MGDLRIARLPSRDPRLKRHLVHDSDSRRFPMRAADTSTWHSRIVRLYDPVRNPAQRIGNCTGCDKAMNGNAAGNRVPGRVLTMADAERIYSLATELDPWRGSWPPDDTGSSGLAACQAAVRLKLGGEYRWALSGLGDAVVQQIVAGDTVGIGTWWTADMFDGVPHPTRPGDRIIEPTGAKAGGHQYRAHGYDEARDLVMIRCWWGERRDYWLKREHLSELLADGGDAHTQRMVPAA